MQITLTTQLSFLRLCLLLQTSPSVHELFMDEMLLGDHEQDYVQKYMLHLYYCI